MLVALLLTGSPGCGLASIVVTKPVTISVQNQINEPFADLNVYAFDGTRYTGYQGVTDEAGRVSLTLPQGAYRFRVDYNGVLFWRSPENKCNVPGCLNPSVTLTGGFGDGRCDHPVQL
jgi:hypothetical protein